jgi:phosphatidylinositol kinase/protein kinase (PI-3  family)
MLWYQVIPQLIARIDTPRQLVSRLVVQLLMDIGKAHPQALIYPLTVAAKSNTPARKNAANKVLKNMCEHSNTLVQQALLVRMSFLIMNGTRVMFENLYEKYYVEWACLCSHRRALFNRCDRSLM